MISLSKVAVVAALTFVAAPVAARNVFECKFTDKAANLGYIPLTVFVARDPESGIVQVADPFIEEVTGGPLEVKVLSATADKLSVSWDILLKSAENDPVKVHYRMTLRDGGKTARLTGAALQYSNTFFADGACKQVEGKGL